MGPSFGLFKPKSISFSLLTTHRKVLSHQVETEGPLLGSQSPAASAQTVASPPRRRVRIWVPHSPAATGGSPVALSLITISGLGRIDGSKGLGSEPGGPA